MTIVFVCGDSVVTPHSCLCFTETHRSHSWCDGMGCYCLQVTPSIDLWPSAMSMTFCNHMCCHFCNGSQEPFFNKAMLSLTRQGLHKTVSAVLLPFLGLPDPQICFQSSICEIIWDGELGIPRV
ncbi:uncharacterized protein TNCV_2857021 [Trichonephila clavipes]|nr:uncharacterized protein TNCV_2857021 [Trichonephila clavipes]